MPIIKEEVFFDDTLKVPTLDELIERRNGLVRLSGDSEEMWQRLGVANRHIERVVNGTFICASVRGEITACLDSAEEWLKACAKT